MSFCTDINFTCRHCHKRNAHTEIEIASPKEDDDISEHVELACSECGELSVIAFHIYNGSCQVDEHGGNGIKVSISDPYYIDDEFLDDIYENYPSNPYKIFFNSVNELRTLLLTAKNTDSGDVINRMIFTQAFSAIEAYLADTLRASIDRDTNPIRNLIENHADLKSKKYSLIDIRDEDGFVKSEVKKFISEQIFHRFDHIDFLYKCYFDYSFLSELVSADRKLLFESVSTRHDCVHRNGYDKNGEKNNLVTPDYVDRVISVFKICVDNIERKIWGSLPGEEFHYDEEIPF
jgi:hypothetical protein